MASVDAEESLLVASPAAFASALATEGIRRSGRRGATSVTFDPQLPATSSSTSTGSARANARPRRRLSRQLSFNERLTLSPLAKFRRYGKFPFKLVFHCLLVAAVSSLVMARNIQYADFNDATQNSLLTLLNDDAQTATELYSISAVLEHLQGALAAYFKFDRASVSPFQVESTVNVSISASGDLDDMSYTATEHDPLGPLAEITPEGFHAVRRITASYAVHILQRGGIIENGPFLTATSLWFCNAVYNLEVGGGRVDYTVHMSSRLLGSSSSVFIFLNAVVLFFAVVKGALTIKSFIKSYTVLNMTKARLNHAPEFSGQLVWRNLNFWDKLSFFNLWNVTAVAGEGLLAVSAILSFPRLIGNSVTHHGDLSTEDVCRAFGLFLMWATLIKYFEWRLEFYMLILAVKASMSRVARFILTVAPLYIAYGLVGVLMFADKADLFGSVSRSASTLFALLNGDSVLLVFDKLQDRVDLSYRLFAQIYLYSFCVLFITTILNMFIFIIEAGYDAAERTVHGKNHQPTVTVETARLKEIVDAAYLRDSAFVSLNADLERRDLSHLGANDDGSNGLRNGVSKSPLREQAQQAALYEDPFPPESTPELLSERAPTGEGREDVAAGVSAKDMATLLAMQRRMLEELNGLRAQVARLAAATAAGS